MPRKYLKDPETIPAEEYDALLISEWLKNRRWDPLLPASADWGNYQWAHENPAAWPLVTLPDGLSLNEAKSIMTARVMFESRHLQGKHNQKSHGRKSGEAISHAEADELAEKAIADGGFTYDVNAGAYRTTGFAVSPYPNRSKEIPADSITGDDIHAYAANNKDLLDKPDHNLGGWHDTENGTVWLDISIVKDDKAEAIKIAKEHNQKAIFDLDTFEEIDTGGTGRSRRSLEPSTVERSVSLNETACPECQANSDPRLVPVHPGCHCDVRTDSVDMGVPVEELNAMLARHAETGVEQVGEFELPEAVQLQPGTTTVFVHSDFRFGDLVEWVRTQAHDFAEDIASEAISEQFHVLVLDEEPVSDDEVRRNIIVSRAIRSIVGDDIQSLLIIGQSLSNRSAAQTRRIIIMRTDATPEELAAAYRMILEGQE